MPPPPTATLDPEQLHAVAFVIACEAGLYKSTPSENAVIQAQDISNTIYARLQSPGFPLDGGPRSAFGIVKDRDGDQFNCYRRIVSREDTTIYADIDSERVLPIAQNLLLGNPPPEPSDSRMKNALYYFGVTYGGSYGDRPANYLPTVSLLANLKEPDICTATLEQLTEWYAGNSPYNLLGATTIFFTQYPGCISQAADSN